ncbi:MAG: hypothetical protein E7048_03690 [Lentisphaerae bacterium]|nr:hypothetical protein [Lentisphaerota bacterium]
MAVKSLLSVLCKTGLLLLTAVSIICSGAEITVSHTTPVFEKPNVFSAHRYSLEPGIYQVKNAPKRHFSVKHPIAYYYDFAELEQGGFISPQLTVNERNEPVTQGQDFQWQLPVTAVLISILAVSVFLFFKWKKEKKILPDSFSENFFLILFVVLVRQILLLSEVAFWGNALPSAADEPGYFKTISDMLQGNFAGPWNFTIGLGIIYLPFILLTGAREYYDIAILFSCFDGLILAPAALGAAFVVLKGFKIRNYCAFAAVLLWALYPFFIYHSEFWDKLAFAPFLSLPTSWDMFPDWWRFYAVCINAGFNAMSDTPGLLAVLCTIAAAQRLSAIPRNLFFIGAAFGFCCLVRINYIFFAPLLAFICYEKMENKTPGAFFNISSAAAGGFLLVFMWQLLINTYQFGNPLTFGYSLHYLDFPPDKRPDTGFNWSTLLELRHIKFLIGSNKLLMTAGIAGLLFTRNSYTRIALSLAAIPLILFFLGYTHTYCDARRFIMMAFPIFLAAFCLGISNCFTLSGEGRKKYLPLLMIPLLLVLWFLPPEIYAICLCLLLLRTLFDLQQQLFRGILRK